MATFYDEKRDVVFTDAQPDAPKAPSVPTEAVPSPIQIKRTVDPSTAAESYLNTFHAPQSAEQIAESMRQGSQGLIDGINKTYDDQVAASRKTGDERLAMDNAVSVLSGLTGSTEAARTRGATLQKNDKEVASINNQRLMDTQKVYSQISQDARAEALKQREDATADANAIVTRRAQSQAKAVDNLKLLAQGGLVDFDSFKNSPQNADVYKHSLGAVGGSEDALRAMFAINRPKEQLVGSPTRIGGKYVQAYQKLDGTVKFESINLPFDLPETYTNFQKLGDNLVAIPEGWDGDTSKLVTIAGSPSTIESLQQRSLELDIAKKEGELSPAPTSEAIQQKNEALTLAKELRADDAVGKRSAVGASAAKLVPFGQALGWQGDRTAFEAKVNTLKSNLTLENLKLLKGAMSDKDLLFLNSIGSSLDTSMSESAFNSELDRVISKLEQSTGSSTRSKVIIKDGQSFDASSLSEAEYQDALRDGYQAQDGPQSFNSVGGDTKTASIKIPQTSRLAYVNNNPGNLRFAGQAGAAKGAGGFARFPSPEAGFKALMNQIKLDASRGLTLLQFVSKYAPPSENDTKQYVQQIASATSTSPTTPIKNISVHALATAIARKESSTRII